jgi:hypothetical protein
VGRFAFARVAIARGPHQSPHFEEDTTMIRILADGENRHRVESEDGRHLGWIRRRVIGLRGFASESDAIQAATRAWHALEAILRREYPGWPRFEPSFDRLRLVHDGAYEWISDGKTPIARLHRPGEAKDSSYGVEFVLPSFSSEGVAIAAALVMARGVADESHLPDIGLAPPAESPQVRIA